MQANQQNRQEVYEQIHSNIQQTVDTMYNKIDGIIQSAKKYVTESPQNADNLVRNVTNYTNYMHKVIDSIVEEYKNFLEACRQNAESGQSQEQNGLNCTPEQLRSFKENVSSLVGKAKQATQKINSLIA